MPEPKVSSVEKTLDIAQDTSERLNKNDRTSWQKPQIIIAKLGNISTKTVADIGAGTGYFAFQLVHRAEKVLAIDIDTNMTQLIDAFKATMSEKNQSKLETRLALADNPNIKNNEVDIALFVNTIAYINNRTQYLNNLREKLKPGGQIAIVDFKVKRLPIDAPNYNERVPMHIIEEELYEAGFSEIVVDDNTLDFQYIIMAK